MLASEVRFLVSIPPKPKEPSPKAFGRKPTSAERLKKLISNLLLVAMSKFRYLALFAVVALAASSAYASAATTVFIDPAVTYAQPGRDFTINVNISTDQQVYGAEFELVFNASALGVSSARDGGFLKKDGNSTFSLINASTSPDGLTGKVRFASTRLGQVGGITGSGSLLDIVFAPLRLVSSQLGIIELKVLNITGANLQQMAAGVANGSVLVNRPPFVRDVDITPGIAYSTSTLDCSFKISEYDAGQTHSADVSWFLNGIAWADDRESLSALPLGTPLNTTAAGDIEPEKLEKGQSWVCSVAVYDSTGGVAYANSSPAVIQNSVPSAPAVRIQPQSAQRPVTTDDLSCVIDTQSADPDGDVIYYSYTWHRNGVLQAGIVSGAVPNARTNRSDVWKCIVTPSDGTGSGQAGETDITIRNANPVLDFGSLTPKLSALATRDGVPISFSIRFYDLDNDPLSYRWFDVMGNNLSASPVLASDRSWTFVPNGTGIKNIWGCADDGSSLSCFIFFTVETRLRGDINNDGKVDISDLASTGLAYGSLTGKPGWNKNADISPLPTEGANEGDGRINIFDLAEVGINYGRPAGVIA